MSIDPRSDGDPDPRKLVRLLEGADWRQIGGRQGLYVRLAPPDDERMYGRLKSLLVPLDTSASDFDELLHQALLNLRDVSGGDNLYAPAVVDRLMTTSTDALRFTKETEAPKGWIQWDAGEALIAAARGLLVAGAKAAREQRSYYGNRFGQFANRFLDEVMMGQTTVGSYVVRAYVPAERSIPISVSKKASEGVHFEGQDVVPTRQVTRALVHTLESASEALAHYRKSESLEGFTDESAGLSFESVTALQNIAQEAEHAGVTVAWDQPNQPNDYEQEFNFTARDVPVFERAATALVRPEPTKDATATGVVHLLSRSEAGGPGVVGLTTSGGVPAKKLRVHLQADDYARAIDAHGNDLFVRVVGILEREGSMSHLYSARVLEVFDPPPVEKFRVSTEDVDTLF